MQAVTEVSETAQELMNSFDDALTTMDCADTESGAHDRASAAFEEAPSQLEELGFEYEITPDGVFFSRPGTAVEEHDPATRIGAAPFLELTGTAELGSLDQVIDVSDFKSPNRFLVLVCPKSKVKGAKRTYYPGVGSQERGPWHRGSSTEAHGGTRRPWHGARSLCSIESSNTPTDQYLEDVNFVRAHHYQNNSRR
jgi:hypothetical protein